MKAITYQDLVTAVCKDMTFDEHGKVLDNGGQAAIEERTQLLTSLLTRIRFVDQTEQIYQEFTLGLKFDLENTPQGYRPVPKPCILRRHKFKVVDIETIPTEILVLFTQFKQNVDAWVAGSISLLVRTIPSGFEEYSEDSHEPT